MPEFAAVANGVSLLMPHVEPYFVRSTRAVLDELDPELADQARWYMSQEMAHQRAHKEFNAELIAEMPALAIVDRFIARVCRWLGRTRSKQFNLAFASGSETIAYAIARWTNEHQHQLLRGAEPAAARLFLWHLAEEVEHKSVAFDVHRGYQGSRRYYLRAMLLCLSILVLTTSISIVVQLWHERRLLHPVAWWRLTTWALSFMFELGPTMLMSALPGHHPSDYVDPSIFAATLREMRHPTA